MNPNRIDMNPTEVIELEPEKLEFEINLGEDDEEDLLSSILPSEETKEPVEEPDGPPRYRAGKVATPPPPPVQEEKPSRKSRKERIESSKKTNPDNVNVDGWFSRQFSKFFDDKDSSMSEENKNNN